MEYNKLVRDKIPEMIASQGKQATTYTADKNEYYARLKAKLMEEVNEFQDDENIEELADILEVLYALCDAMGIPREKLEETRHNKEIKRGAFQDRIILERIMEDSSW
ncbi:MAG: nucleoside triphosphate pyrophosphohydrolase [Spirochaetales bacterium]|nr:nucleoside triphosphate pyrophosphohydrolase [Spirochaetales bacterium]